MYRLRNREERKRKTRHILLQSTLGQSFSRQGVAKERGILTLRGDNEYLVPNYPKYGSM